LGGKSSCEKKKIPLSSVALQTHLCPGLKGRVPRKYGNEKTRCAAQSVTLEFSRGGANKKEVAWIRKWIRKQLATQPVA
jgi:hypothetical protein